MYEPQDLITCLLDPATYPQSPEEVTKLETHVSWLFFAGERVYKVKKPVKTGFLDFTSLAARKHACEEELRLNRRLTAWMYLGLRAVRRNDSGRISLDGEGQTIEYAVEMRRLPAERMLDRLLSEGKVDNRMMRALARKLARFHAQSASGDGVDEHGCLAAVQRNCRENFADLKPLGFHADLIEFLRARTEDFLDEHAELFARRLREGRIREGHGDLHAGNICILDEEAEQIAIYDCLEFAARLRCGDVAADLAFLLMDLDMNGFRAFGGYLLHEYQERTGDRGMSDLIPFYKVYRALVRCKVSALRARQLGNGDRREPMRFLNLAVSYCLPPSLILTCGLPGSGKSWVAKQLAEGLEFAVFNSDRTRKRLAGMPAEADGSAEFGAGLYTAARSAATYGELLRKARESLASGRSVVIDAGMRTADQRLPFRELARELDLPCFLLHVDPGDALIRERLARRAEQRDEASDADLAVYEQAVAGFEAPGEFDEGEGLRISGDLPGEQLLEELLLRISARARSHPPRSDRGSCP